MLSLIGIWLNEISIENIASINNTLFLLLELRQTLLCVLLYKQSKVKLQTCMTVFFFSKINYV